MSVEDDYLKCIGKLEDCVCEIKKITHKLNDIAILNVQSAIFEIEAGVEKLEHELEADIERKNNNE